MTTLNILKGSLIVVTVSLLFASCSGSGKTTGVKPGTVKGLKDFYKDYFPIGVAVTPRMLHGEDSALIVDQFNSLTAENAMKMGPLHPRENEYFWKDGDEIAAFAQKHGMRLRGHNLCWHAQAPNWMFKDAKGE